MTPQTQILRYRSEHRIQPSYGFRPHGKVMTCAVDGIRIHANAGGRPGWRHDIQEIREASEAGLRK